MYMYVLSFKTFSWGENGQNYFLFNYLTQGFQYFSSLPVLHYLQAVLFIKI